MTVAKLVVLALIGSSCPAEGGYCGSSSYDDRPLFVGKIMNFKQIEKQIELRTRIHELKDNLRTTALKDAIKEMLEIMEELINDDLARR